LKVLFLSQRIPFPPNRGDRITTYHVVRHLARKHEVAVACFCEERERESATRGLESLGVKEVRADPFSATAAKARAALSLLGGRPFTLAYFRSRALQRDVEALLRGGADLAYVYSSSMAPYVFGAGGIRRIMHFSELDSDKWAQYAQRSRQPARWVWAREAKTLLEFERAVAHRFDASVFVSEIEAALFRERIPGVEPVVLPNGVDLARFAPGPPAARDPRRIVFTGMMDYPPNVDAVRWFAGEILPRIRREVPEARFDVVGARAPSSVRALHDGESVCVVGEVAETAQWLRKSAVAVAPMRVARGIMNKVLEAMACALPVVATPVAARGVDAVPGEHLFVEPDEDRFAARVVALLRDERLRAEVGLRARARMEERYRWEGVEARLDSLVERVAARPIHPDLAPSRR
jgi:sugar transferase (PEP-CTERM/EpsH1 system associated)